jgi:S-adenosylmethionine:tRNA ribosyltransferase-isomerase
VDREKRLPLLTEIKMEEYNYSLPLESIAMAPSANRDESKLLIYQNQHIQEDQYKNISHHLNSNAHLVFNNTKVIAARILFKKITGGEIEIFLLEPANSKPHEQALLSSTTSNWKCLIGGVKKWKNNEAIYCTTTGNDPITISARLKRKYDDYYEVEFAWEPSSLAFSSILSLAGKIPLPPYIKREATSDDSIRYQTAYAKTEGSVAAPTAGLHFTPHIFDSLNKKNIVQSFLTLHVGAGTFKPVSSETIAEHTMHEEYFEVSKKTIEDLLDNDKLIIAVGTTSLRTLESLYWIGVKQVLQLNNQDEIQHVGQWENITLQTKSSVSKHDALNALIDMMENKNIESITGTTGICITPGYQFKIIQGLITNFHQPQSTLLLIIAAIVGEKWKEIYAYALQHKFRFLSYGDGSLLFIE